MSDLWSAASIDVEGENHLRSFTAAKLSVAGLWPFLAAAEGPGDFANRLALVVERLEASIPNDDVRTEVVASLTHDFNVLDEHRFRTAQARKQAVDSSGHSPTPSKGYETAPGGMPKEYTETPCAEAGCSKTVAFVPDSGWHHKSGSKVASDAYDRWACPGCDFTTDADDKAMVQQKAWEAHIDANPDHAEIKDGRWVKKAAMPPEFKEQQQKFKDKAKGDSDDDDDDSGKPWEKKSGSRHPFALESQEGGEKTAGFIARVTAAAKRLFLEESKTATSGATCKTCGEEVSLTVPSEYTDKSRHGWTHDNGDTDHKVDPSAESGDLEYPRKKGAKVAGFPLTAAPYDKGRRSGQEDAKAGRPKQTIPERDESGDPSFYTGYQNGYNSWMDENAPLREDQKKSAKTAGFPWQKGGGDKDKKPEDKKPDPAAPVDPAVPVDPAAPAEVPTDIAELQPATEVTLHYKLQDGTEGDTPATFDHSDGTSWNFTYDKGTFVLTQTGNTWTDPLGTEFTLGEPAAPPVDPAAAPAQPGQPPAPAAPVPPVKASRKTAYGDVFCPYCGREGCSPDCPGPSGGTQPCPNCGATAHVNNGVLTCDSCGEGHAPGSMSDTDPESAGNRRFNSSKTAGWADNLDNSDFYSTGIDNVTRGMLQQILLSLSPENAAKFQALPLMKAVDVGWKLVKGSSKKGNPYTDCPKCGENRFRKDFGSCMQCNYKGKKSAAWDDKAIVDMNDPAPSIVCPHCDKRVNLEVVHMSGMVKFCGHCGGRLPKLAYTDDPYWKTASIPGTCFWADCNDPIKPGDEVFFFPLTGASYVGVHASAAARDFASSSADEGGFSDYASKTANEYTPDGNPYATTPQPGAGAPPDPDGVSGAPVTTKPRQMPPGAPPQPMAQPMGQPPMGQPPAAPAPAPQPMPPRPTAARMPIKCENCGRGRSASMRAITAGLVCVCGSDDWDLDDTITTEANWTFPCPKCSSKMKLHLDGGGVGKHIYKCNGCGNTVSHDKAMDNAVELSNRKFRESSQHTADDNGGLMGMIKAFRNFVMGGGDDTIPSWFPKSLLLPEEIASGHLISGQGGDPQYAYGSLDDRFSGLTTVGPGDGGHAWMERQKAKRQEFEDNPEAATNKYMKNPYRGKLGYEDLRSNPGWTDNNNAPLDDVKAVQEDFRCSSCLAQFKDVARDPAQPMPACPSCGSTATTAAGATIQPTRPTTAAKVAQITTGILSTNPGMTRETATRVATETLRRYPKMAIGSENAGIQCSICSKAIPKGKEWIAQGEAAMSRACSEAHAKQAIEMVNRAQGIPSEVQIIPPGDLAMAANKRLVTAR